MRFTRGRMIGDEFVIEIPPDIVERYGLKEGDELECELRDGGIVLRLPTRKDVVGEAYEVLRDRYRNTLRDLADS